MITHEELVEAFGEDNVVLLDAEKARSAGLSEMDMLILTHVGFPRYAGPLFTTDIVGQPALFQVEEFPANGVINRVMFLGGPEDDDQARFFLDIPDGFIVFMALTDDGSEAEVINSTLSDFLEFVYRFGVRYQSPAPETIEEVRQETDELDALLRDRDPHAFRQAQTWWSMAIDAIREQSEKKYA
ncbi:hypothetical protein GCM10022225_72430 [Plantactinospora mayteni]|uniref:SUKH-4 immunity protein of toxin-antitoxin system n=1 Tax=Plantactinospora mayteni TaxID=566021 RepID=A0ABQ4F1A4_9ACTN|nr:SUKH-4 family immunity protein [Plantactinospora mayteni]GIH00697.1 hypothetical protein Pma05_72690 [Plantactinospora mayteni]